VLDGWETFLDLGVALAVGFALGLQRERVHATTGRRAVGGVRTFPVLALVGAVSALLPGTPWPVLGAFLSVGALVLAGYLRSPPDERGITTEALALLTFGLGALSASGQRAVAAVVGGAALILASRRKALHGFAGKLTEEDEVATVKFVAVALLVFPFLPDRDLGPFGALNPHDIGRMILLVAGVSFVGYVLVKTVGAHRGLLLTGVLGGLASTTATTASFARRSKESPTLSPPLSTATIAANAVLFPRVLLLAAVASPALLRPLAVPLGVMAAACVLPGAVLALSASKHREVEVALRNPFELAPAFWFALFYAAARLVARAVIQWFGPAALYAVGAASGVADVDAITLTAAGLDKAGEAPTAVVVRVIALAVIVNGLVKSGIALSLGSPAYGRRTAAILGASSAVGAGWFVWDLL
jgi:uncharacterized membrane protein (DUF4010 family)